MKNTRKIQVRTIENKEKLITSADDLFMVKGFYNTTSKEIAKHAGVSTGVFYNYFDNKTDIFIEIYKTTCSYSYKYLENLISDLSLENVDYKSFFIKYIRNGIKAACKNRYLYDDLESLKKESCEVYNIYHYNNDKMILLLQDFIKNLYHVDKDINYNIKCQIILNTLQSNANTIVKIKDDKQKDEYINNLIDMLYKFIFDNMD
ncbi:TetR/AcrR family transcriptional regulator [Clostridium estertheticum]|uniref:TetR/AcrR family transcriptional regulator n=1 Tax=Clostridium estertheticum TaxID=238834 RepID=UPI001CF34965|nr:TetR/AcrR family transcriptional regulator [Clostridium estertheticum]MCB2356483.1 TetR/AcrR family transcriptional regulator [Clostridium estertheticum]WAG43831.1 TetR/AcrR family transcriptional regulator [Clostridium estertheticum]